MLSRHEESASASEEKQIPLPPRGIGMTGAPPQCKQATGDAILVRKANDPACAQLVDRFNDGKFPIRHFLLKQRTVAQDVRCALVDIGTLSQPEQLITFGPALDAIDGRADSVDDRFQIRGRQLLS